MTPDQPISVVLQNVIQKNFPDDYKQRCIETEAEKIQDLTALPLFLLPSVAFPGQSFPLHIFEPRYKLMIRRCLAGSRRFGLVCATASHPNGGDVGCLLDITDLQVLADGRSFLNTVGTRRFKVLDKWLQDGYMNGKVQLFSDIGAGDPAALQESIQLVEEIQLKIQEIVAGEHACGGMKQLVKSLGEMPPKNNPERFSFWVASKLPLTAAQALLFLSGTSSAERLRLEIELINHGTSSPHSANCCMQ